MKIHAQALLFDVFGTLVDWRTSLIEDLSAFGAEHAIEADWPALVDAWRGQYVPAMDRVRRGERPWTVLDTLHRESFDELAERFGFAARLTEDDRRWCVDRWHHLRPWPDTVAGLKRLRENHILGTLSNGNVRLLTDLARHAPLPMDLILSAELFQHYKRDPEVYRGAIALLAMEPGDVMLVAAHNDDLLAARSEGMRTAFVRRPFEHGPGQIKDLAPVEGIDVGVHDLVELADLL
jgi:2-haloacid dehalogenase